MPDLTNLRWCCIIMYRSSDFFVTFIKLNWHFLKCEWCKTHNYDTRTSAVRLQWLLVVLHHLVSVILWPVVFFLKPFLSSASKLILSIVTFTYCYISLTLSSGSHIENWHSVLRNGLVNASYTKLQVCKLHQSADLRLVSWLDSSCSDCVISHSSTSFTKEWMLCD